MDSIYLVGAEDVKRAASSMYMAAEEMASAARTISSAHEQQRQWMEAWLDRFEALVDRLLAPGPLVLPGVEDRRPST